MRELEPVTPGELLREEFLAPMGISQYRLAKEIGVPTQRISDIIAANAPSPPTLTCGFVASSAWPMATGYERRPHMTLK